LRLWATMRTLLSDLAAIRASYRHRGCRQACPNRREPSD
jgi:hypothetical protein